MNNYSASGDINVTELLYEIGASFTTINDISALLDSLFKTLSGHLPLKRGMILIHDVETDHIVIDSSYGYTDDEVLRGDYRPGEGIVGSVIATGDPVIVPSVRDEPRFLNRTGARKDRDGDTAFIAVPVKAGRVTIGSISVDLDTSSGPPLDTCLEILTTIAIMTAYAVNSRREMRRRERALEEENRLLKEKLSGDQGQRRMIGNSAVMQSLYDKALMVAGTDSTVLITGESGTGKELVADEIHHHSARKERPFVKVNIAAIPENLIASELFGYEKGAFTGAFKQKKGRFEQADGGTIFLDEIGDLSRELQVHLLRVIQEKRIDRLGGSTSIPIDVRIITATHQDLESMLAAGTFRSDLYYRINVFPIHIPPLRERKADIIHLGGSLSRQYTGRSSTSPSRGSAPTPLTC